MEYTKLVLKDKTELKAPMQVPMTAEGKGVGQVGYQVFLQDMDMGAKDIRLHMEAINRASKMFFSEVISVLHPFGGLAMAAQCMDATLGRRLVHEFWERDPDCVAALRGLRPTSVVCQVTDSFTTLLRTNKGDFVHYDLVFLDPTAMTAKKEGLWGVWTRLAEDQVENVWFVDSAISKVWLHLKTYSEFFGEPVANIQDYFRGYARMLGQRGYTIVDLCREGTVVYGTVKRSQPGVVGNLAITDLR